MGIRRRLTPCPSKPFKHRSNILSHCSSFNFSLTDLSALVEVSERTLLPAVSESTSERMYGENRDRKSCLTRWRSAGMYVRGSKAGKTTYSSYNQLSITHRAVAQDREGVLTTKISPRPFSIVHLTLYPSLSIPSDSFLTLPSMNVSLTRALTGDDEVRARSEKVGVKERDQRIRPPAQVPSVSFSDSTHRLCCCSCKRRARPRNAL